MTASADPTRPCVAVEVSIIDPTGVDSFTAEPHAAWLLAVHYQISLDRQAEVRRIVSAVAELDAQLVAAQVRHARAAESLWDAVLALEPSR